MRLAGDERGPQLTRLPQPFRVLGEDAPTWLVILFAVVGLSVPLTVIWVWMGDADDGAIVVPSSQVGAFGSKAGSAAVTSSTSVAPTTTTAPDEIPGPTGAEVAGTSTTDVEEPAATPLVTDDCPEPVTIQFERASASPLVDPADPTLLALIDWLLADPTRLVHDRRPRRRGR